MARRRHHYKRRTNEAPELDITTFLNLMVVLIPFLLITAVFSRLTIVELDLPSASAGNVTTEPNFRLEVIVREDPPWIGFPSGKTDYVLLTFADIVLAHVAEDIVSRLLGPLAKE